MKSATKLVRHYPPHLRHVTTLPWEIKRPIFVDIQKIEENANNFISFPAVQKFRKSVKI